jgi:hypothetical protein
MELKDGYRLTLAILATLAIAGCSGASSEPEQAGPPRDEASSTDAPRTGPLARLEEVLDLDAKVQEARHRIERQCMEAKGFRIHPEPPPPVRIDTLLTPPSSSPTLDDAKRDGYGFGSSDKREAQSDTTEEGPFSALLLILWVA